MSRRFGALAIALMMSVTCSQAHARGWFRNWLNHLFMGGEGPKPMFTIQRQPAAPYSYGVSEPRAPEMLQTRRDNPLFRVGVARETYR